MTTKIALFHQIYRKLSDYLQNNLDNGIVLPTAAETIMFLNNQPANVRASDLEKSYYQKIPQYQNVTDEVREQVRLYIDALLELTH